MHFAVTTSRREELIDVTAQVAEFDGPRTRTVDLTVLSGVR